MSYFTRRAGLVATIALCLTAVQSADAALTGTHDGDSKVILENENAWAKAALDGDADKMAALMADDYLELAWRPAAGDIPSHWGTTTKAEWVQGVRSRQDVYTSVDLRNLTVHLQGNIAVVTGEYSQKGSSGSKDISGAGIYANTWTKRNGRWLVVHSVFP